MWRDAGTIGTGLANDAVHRQSINSKKLRYFLIDIRLNLEWIQRKDIHRTNLDIRKIYNKGIICD